MYSNTGYLNDEDIELEDKNHPLTVCSCGIYRLIHQAAMTTIRPKGRTDYQLLYITAGKAFFLLGETEKELSAGHMILYRPGESQHYYYYVEDKPEVYWIHFSGCDVSDILDKIGFFNTQILFCGISFQYLELFRQMILELQLKRPCFEELLCHYLHQLFTEIHRGQLEISTESCRYQKEMEATVHYFNEFFTKDISIEGYAKSLHMSVSWFIRSFRQYMGMPPMQYITSIRINKAKELLKNTDYSIQEISGLVGYENPLYFSRMFRKQTGISPSAYRKE